MRSSALLFGESGLDEAGCEAHENRERRSDFGGYVHAGHACGPDENDGRCTSDAAGNDFGLRGQVEPP